MKYDFSGYATKIDIPCSDGRTIRHGAFNENDGQIVPLVWRHGHDSPANVLGHSLLEARDDGVYCYNAFNDTESGRNAKALVQHGDIVALSIYANGLRQKGNDVIHGMIREVSLVLSGANPGALIDNVVIEHEDGTETEIPSEALIFSDSGIDLKAGEFDTEVPEDEPVDISHSDGEEKPGRTIGEIYNSMSQEQQDVVSALVGMALTGGEEDEEAEHSEEGDDEDMKNNVFDNSKKGDKKYELTHDQFNAIMTDAEAIGSFRKSFMAHAVDYGIENIDYLFPDAKALGREPEVYARDTGWVAGFLRGVHHVPFSRVKTLVVDLTADEARAKGYVKASLKKDEVVELLKRTTEPKTVYKKQKLDRDDILDITDLNVVAWLKKEMRWMLDEELARAMLVGDGRDAEDEDKISESNIRPIWTDDDFYAHHVTVAADKNVSELIEEIIRARKHYKGSGSPTMYISSDALTDMLLLKDTTGRRIYTSVQALAAELRVSKIVEVPVMEDLQREDGDDTLDLICIIVNLRDYTVGADKGGQISMFSDFDIDYNQEKYLVETRISAALDKPKAALVVEQVNAG
jgi:HK97 family phage major capsid protein